MSLCAALGPTTLAGVGHWMFLLWTAVVLFFSPLLFVVCVTLPELPVLMVRRVFYATFDSR